MRVSYKRYIATASNDNPQLSTLTGEWENSHNFYLESLNNCLHYILVVLLNLYSFGMSYESPKSAIFGCKTWRGGATNFVAKIVLPLLKLPGSRSELRKALTQLRSLNDNN